MIVIALFRALRRKRQILIPRGETMLRPDDVLVVVAEGEAVRRLCLKDKDQGA